MTQLHYTMTKQMVSVHQKAVFDLAAIKSPANI